MGAGRGRGGGGAGEGLVVHTNWRKGEHTGRTRDAACGGPIRPLIEWEGEAAAAIG